MISPSDKSRELRDRLESIRAKALAKKHARRLPGYVYLDEVYSEMLTALDRLLHDLPDIASTYRFFCMELPEQVKDNKYVKLTCEVAKMTLRSLLASIRSRIDWLKKYLGKKGRDYAEFISALDEVGHLVEGFLRNPHAHLSDVLKVLEERERDIVRREWRLQRFIDKILELSEQRGLIIVHRRAKATVYVCAVCDTEFLNPMDAVVHVLENHLEA